jgi:hypothetical protein
MQQTTINRHPGIHDTVTGAFWLLAGVIVLIVSGDAFAVLIAAIVIVTTIWWTIREIEHRIRNRAPLATVIHLRPASTSQREPKNTPTHASRRGPSAA